MCKGTTWGSLGLGWGLGFCLFEEASCCCCFWSVVFCVVRQDCMHKLDVFVSTWISQKRKKRKKERKGRKKPWIHSFSSIIFQSSFLCVCFLWIYFVCLSKYLGWLLHLFLTILTCFLSLVKLSGIQRGSSTPSPAHAHGSFCPTQEVIGLSCGRFIILEKSVLCQLFPKFPALSRTWIFSVFSFPGSLSCHYCLVSFMCLVHFRWEERAEAPLICHVIQNPMY